MRKLLTYRQLNKAIIIALLSLAMLVMLSATAFAGGWHKIGPAEGNTTNEWNPDAGLWSNTSVNPDTGQKEDKRVPHANLATTGNNCKTCHVVHNADNGQGDSFKLLRNNNRITECNACHDALSGLSVKRPYQVGEGEKPIRGEHSLGSTIIPDSDSSIIFNGINKDGLVCGSCHSVHGGATLGGPTIDPTWASKILRKDPGGNGGDAGVSSKYDSNSNGTIDENDQIIPGGLSAVTTTNSNAANNYGASKTAFCADCHNKNSNWDEDEDDNRPNSQSHVQGINVNGVIQVNGKDTQVANFIEVDTSEPWTNDEVVNSGRSDWRLQQNTQRGCVSCHQATTGGSTFPYNGQSSSFPHQSNGTKLLQENFTNAETGWVNDRDAKGIRQSNRGINQGGRFVASLDKVCLDCHRNRRALGIATPETGDDDTMGVGKTF